MKELITLVFLVIIAIGCAQAQDIIITNSDVMIKVYNLEIGNNTVFYQLSDDVNAPIKKMAKSDIFIIKKADGSRLNPNEENSEKPIVENSTDQNAPVLVTCNVDKKRRQEIIDSYTAEVNLIPKVRHDNFNKGLKKKSKSKKDFYVRALGFWRPSANSDVCSEDLEIEITPRCVYDEWNDGYTVYLKNRTDRTIYVDMANTFEVLANGKFENYYHGTITSSTSGTGSGVAVNLGAVAGALGIGGSIGTLASGVTVGKSSSNSSTTTTVEQRVLSIPPGGRICITNNFKFMYVALPDSIVERCQKSFHWNGDQIDVSEGTVKPVSFIATYSFVPDFSTYSVFNTKFEMYRVFMHYMSWYNGYGSTDMDFYRTYFDVISGNLLMNSCSKISIKPENVIVPDK